MKFEIRDAVDEDINYLKNLSRNLSLKEEEEFDQTIDPDWNLSEEAEEYFDSRINQENGFAIVAEVEEEIIGYLIGGINQAEEFRDTDQIAEAETMYIEPKYRGEGLGSEMFKNFVTWSKERGVERARVEASAENTGAINFYRKHEFKEYSVTLERELD